LYIKNMSYIKRESLHLLMSMLVPVYAHAYMYFICRS